MKITDRYAGAINATNLVIDPGTTFSSTDVLGAYGMAGKAHPLAVALARLLCGDNRDSGAVVHIIAEMAFKRARTIEMPFKRLQAVSMAQACIAWKRSGVCRPCGGHGVEYLPGTPHLSDIQCKFCHGTGKIPFEKQFITLGAQHVELANWLINVMERELAKSGPEAIRRIGANLEL